MGIECLQRIFHGDAVVTPGVPVSAEVKTDPDLKADMATFKANPVPFVAPDE